MCLAYCTASVGLAEIWGHIQPKNSERCMAVFLLSDLCSWSGPNNVIDSQVYFYFVKSSMQNCKKYHFEIKKST